MIDQRTYARMLDEYLGDHRDCRRLPWLRRMGRCMYLFWIYQTKDWLYLTRREQVLRRESKHHVNRLFKNALKTRPWFLDKISKEPEWRGGTLYVPFKDQA